MVVWPFRGKLTSCRNAQVQQQKRLSVVSGEEKPDAPVQAWGNRLESSLAEKELGVLVQKKLNMCQQSFLAVKKSRFGVLYKKELDVQE